MKTHSNIEIPVFQNLGTDRWYYHFNHSAVINAADPVIGEELGVTYSADTIVVSGQPEKNKIENALISPVTDKGDIDDVYAIGDAPELDNDLSLVVSYTNDYYRSITRQDVSGLEWLSNEVVKVGQVRTNNGILYECLQSHITQIGWEPDKTQALWRVWTDPNAEPDISEWVQPISTNPYMKGDKVLFNGVAYESTIDNNVWSLQAYPQGWRKL